MLQNIDEMQRDILIKSVNKSLKTIVARNRIYVKFFLNLIEKSHGRPQKRTSGNRSYP